MRVLTFCRLAILVFACLNSYAAVAQRPGRAEALALESQGQTSEAEQVWKAILNANADNPEALAHLGLFEARQEHYPQAIEFYKRALVAAPGMPGVETNLGLAYFKNAQFAEALTPFANELKRHPDDLRLILLLGMSHYGLGDYLVAIPFLQRSARQQGTSLPLRLALAHSCLWTRQFECVKATYKEILTLNPGSAEAEMLVGEALDETGDDAGAIEHFRAAANANTKEPDVHFGLGYLLWTENHYAEAAQEFALELDNNPDHGQAHVYLGDSYVQLNRFADAETHLRAALKLDPQSELSYRNLGIVNANAGDLVQAEAELRRAITLDPTDTAAHYRLARVLKSLGKQEEASSEFKKVGDIKQHRNDLLRTMQEARPVPKAAP